VLSAGKISRCRTADFSNREKEIVATASAGLGAQTSPSGAGEVVPCRSEGLTRRKHPSWPSRCDGSPQSAVLRRPSPRDSLVLFLGVPGSPPRGERGTGFESFYLLSRPIPNASERCLDRPACVAYTQCFTALRDNISDAAPCVACADSESGACCEEHRCPNAPFNPKCAGAIRRMASAPE
jgi:hypothetical protein